ncbi:hypothetical protein DFP73DRAFT_591419 [Morchella snyderi]|nr:hypothetical protein DFP73DRAFT_591419 [Morchella snyderi]
MERLGKWYRSEEIRSRQKTGELEEFNEHLRNMIDIVLLYDSVSNNNLIRQDAKGKIEERKAKGAQVRQSSQTGLVRKRDLMETDSDKKGNSEPAQKVVRSSKIQFAKEVEEVIGGLREKTEEFRIAIQEKTERERIESEETTAREHEKADRDRDLRERLDVLIESSRSTNKSMEKLMNILIQSLCLLEGWRKTVVSEVDGGRYVHYGAKLLRDIRGR